MATEAVGRIQYIIRGVRFGAFVQSDDLLEAGFVIFHIRLFPEVGEGSDDRGEGRSHRRAKDRFQVLIDLALQVNRELGCMQADVSIKNLLSRFVQSTLAFRGHGTLRRFRANPLVLPCSHTGQENDVFTRELFGGSKFEQISSVRVERLLQCGHGVQTGLALLVGGLRGPVFGFHGLERITPVITFLPIRNRCCGRLSIALALVHVHQGKQDGRDFHD